ncbi:T9SS type A sorting domain-containing protein [Chitinophaga sedimenti]|uniref:T9SS type A sorting domain-containing protein n=1 Tax=Chitinophaga sedimenti TaxID=2033606 RepID=UPI0020043732|nr:T9SS type A sorting domain-containing protein [Chitinophaga sedimenti]MCK7557676.1 T9SS type A sorting domain-containing protein [Chitinophaga sedimenti]
MLKDYQQLPLVNSLACSTVTSIPDVNQNAGTNLITNYPNPFTTKTVISYETTGGHTLIQVFDTMGRLLATPLDKVVVAGKYTIEFDATMLPTGIYYARFQNGTTQQVRTMLKVR